jgi:TM2 domain-containing membrane protein YozV
MLRWRSGVDALVQRSMWAALLGLALLGALTFFGAAVFLLAQAEFGTVRTLLGFGFFFVALALMAAIGLSLARRKARRRQAVAAQAASAAAPWWLDSRLLATGLDLSRTLGGRRAISVGLAGAFLVGLWLSRSVDRK